MWNQTLRGLALVALIIGAPAAHGHGGPPSTHEVLGGSGPISLVTSHGFFSEDTGWEWICEEATGADLAASATRTPSRWLVGTSEGLSTSGDGCDWSMDPALEGAHILRVLQDVLEPDRAWIATQDAVWLVNGDQDAVLEMKPDLSLRHMGQRADGTLLLVGFDGPDPTALLGEQRIPLPAQTGRIEVLSADEQGRFYVRFPAGFTDRLVRVGDDGAEVLIPSTQPIRDVSSIGDHLYVLYGEGVSWSADDGLTWSEPQGDAITCLTQTSDGIYACPPAMDPAAIVYAKALGHDPATWVWETALNFDEVTNNTCPVGTTAGNICPYLWRFAGEELGALSSQDEDTPTTHDNTTLGCGASPSSDQSTWPLLLLTALWLVTRPINRCTRGHSSSPVNT